MFLSTLLYVVYVTKGALEKLNEHELDAVMAHEFSHIVNKDAYYLTLGIIVGGITVILSYIILRIFLYGPSSSRGSRRRDRKGTIIDLILFLFAIILATISPIIRMYLLSKFSRNREYAADANASIVTKYPPAIISVLAKVARENTEISLSDKDVPKTFALLLFDYESFETHPPVWERILRITQTTRTPIDPKFLEEIKNIERSETKKASEIDFLKSLI